MHTPNTKTLCPWFAEQPIQLNKDSLCTMQACKALTDITVVLGEDFTINGQTIKTNQITLPHHGR